MTSTRLAGKVAIITGAARGQGAAEARLFVAEGAQVMLCDVSPEGVSLAEELGSYAHFMRHDVADEQSWSHVVEEALRRFGHIDVLVNNAGIYRPAIMRETSIELWDLHYRTNQLGVFLGMRAVTEVMASGGGGSIVNVASNAGLRNVGGIFAYATTKWAARGMSKLAATELAPLKIRVNCIHPGIIDTPMLAANTAERLEMYEALIPMGRVGLPEEVANLALFLASDESSYVTGAEILWTGALAELMEG